MKSTASPIVLASLVATFLLCCISGRAQSNDSVTADDAIALAIQYTGFDKSPTYLRPDVEQVVRKIAADSTTPYLAREIDGREVWEVPFDSIYLESPSAMKSFEESQLIKSYRVWIGCTDDRLLRIFTTNVAEDVVPEPSSSQAEKSLREEYLRIPDEVPEVSFYESLVEARFLRPLECEEIIAHLVVYTRFGSEPTPCWAIQARRLHPYWPSDGVNVPDYLGRMRMVIDANSGTQLWISTAPEVTQEAIEEFKRRRDTVIR